MGLRDRFSHAWNAFTNSESNKYVYRGYTTRTRYDRHIPNTVNGKTIISSIYNRIANDAASVNWEHVRVDENEQFIDNMDTGLNRCLTVSTNLDQNARDFKLDVVLSLLDEGVVAIVPVDTNLDPSQTAGYDILSLRVGPVLEWAPKEVQVRLYNEETGKKEDIWLPKKDVAIVENPFYSVMNAPNSTLKRLNQKLALLDAIDNQSIGRNLDLIIQLPYSVKSPIRKSQAQERIDSLTEQLTNSDYGIGYIDATEHITQLNRPISNNLMPQIEYLTKLLYSQLGISDTIFNGTATEEVMLNYQQRVLEPILSAITIEMTRKWITRTGYTQGQRIQYYMDRFKLADISNLGNFMDQASRNAVMTPNEFRSILGLKASTSDDSNELKNRNMPEDSTEDQAPPNFGEDDADVMGPSISKPKYDANTILDQLNS